VPATTTFPSLAIVIAEGRASSKSNPKRNMPSPENVGSSDPA
jgi:hypothetical protein